MVDWLVVGLEVLEQSGPDLSFGDLQSLEKSELERLCRINGLAIGSRVDMIERLQRILKPVISVAKPETPPPKPQTPPRPLIRPSSPVRKFQEVVLTEEEDIDGAPIDDGGDDDLDGVPLDEDDLDGIPIDVDDGDGDGDDEDIDGDPIDLSTLLPHKRLADQTQKPEAKRHKP